MPRAISYCNGNMVFAIVTGAMGAFQCGYHSALFTTDQTFLKNWFVSILHERAEHPHSVDFNNTNETTTERPFVERGEDLLLRISVSIFYLGGIIGALFVGHIADKYGRRQGLWGGNSVILYASLILFSFCQKAQSYEMFMAGRFLIGLNGGLDSGLCPMYLSEIPPVRLRGATASFYALILSFSFLVSKILTIEQIMGNDHWWNLLPNVIAIVPGSFQMFLLFFIHESPRYVLDKKGQHQSLRKLMWFRKASVLDVDDEFGEMIEENDKLKSRPKIKFLDLFRKEYLKRPLLLCVVICAGKEIVSINNVVKLSGRLMQQIGNDRAYTNIGLSIMDLLGTVMFIPLVEVVGRRKLLLASFAGMAITSSIIFFTYSLSYEGEPFAYATIVLFFIHVGFFSIGPGPYSWFIAAELFTQNSRHLAMTVTATVTWTTAFILDIGFDYYANFLGPFLFFLIASFLIFFYVITVEMMKETKNRTILEIVSYFGYGLEDEPLPDLPLEAFYSPTSSSSQL